MKSIILAEDQGFCWGVRRALDIVGEYERAYILGDLIHNKQVVADLEKKGKKVIAEASGREDGPVVITAHGNTVENFRKLRKVGVEIVDTTCPLVEAIYRVGERFEGEGRRIVIIGDKNHIEVKGIASRMNDPFIIKDEKELSGIKLPDKVGVICQSTFSEDRFDEIVEVLRSVAKDLKVKNTTCSPTRKRQKAAKELARKVDVMVTIGGYHSSNTRKLAEINSRHAESRHVETADQLDPRWFEGKHTVGVTAGASTADRTIKEICRAIEVFLKSQAEIPTRS